MFFFAEHRHTGKTCFSQDDSKKKLFEDLITSSSENGVKVHQYLKNTPEHRFFSYLKQKNMILFTTFLCLYLLWEI